MPENCERDRKSARNYANDSFFHSCVLIFYFSRKNPIAQVILGDHGRLTPRQSFTWIFLSLSFIQS